MAQSIDLDVLVCGSEPAGFSAALAAARSGARTLLVERYGFCGGIGAYCLGMPINQVRPDGQPRGAIHELIISHLQAYGEDALRVVDHALVCNVEYLKAALMDALDEVGCSYWLHSPVVGALVEGDHLLGVLVGSKQGIREIRAKAVVDATGDADVAFFAGAETMKGRENDGFLSPMTLCLMIGNIDTAAARRFQQGGGLGRVIEQGRSRFPLLPASMGFELGPHPTHHILVINHSGTRLAGVLDGSAVEDLTRAEAYSRRQAIQIVEALRAFGGAIFREVQLLAAAPQVGVRETRRVKGEYILTEEDAKSGQRFTDAVAWRSGFLDIGFVRFEPMRVHDVPYRALLPARVENLLAAGRCISASHVAASAGKSMGNCMATGHAAGLAAALAASQGVSPRALPVQILQAALRADGVPLARSAVEAA